MGRRHYPNDGEPSGKWNGTWETAGFIGRASAGSFVRVWEIRLVVLVLVFVRIFFALYRSTASQQSSSLGLLGLRGQGSRTKACYQIVLQTSCSWVTSTSPPSFLICSLKL